jgi:hypothetical protein
MLTAEFDTIEQPETEQPETEEQQDETDSSTGETAGETPEA